MLFINETDMLIYWSLQCSGLMRYAVVQGEIIDEISYHHKGISFNSLARRLHGRVSRVKLLSEVNTLQREGLILVETDPKHKQRKLFRLGQRLRDVVDKIRSIEDKASGNPLGDFSSLLSDYVNDIISAREDWRKEFMRHRLQMYVRRMLVRLEGGTVDG
jgi:DNA-binding HxlR family transcriptional regulator